MAEKDEGGYTVRLALFLDDNGPCPRASDYGLTFDEAKRCEYDALTERLHTVERERDEALNRLTDAQVMTQQAREHDLSTGRMAAVVYEQQDALRDRVAELERERDETAEELNVREGQLAAAEGRVEALEAALRELDQLCDGVCYWPQCKDTCSGPKAVIARLAALEPVTEEKR